MGQHISMWHAWDTGSLCYAWVSGSLCAMHRSTHLYVACMPGSAGPSVPCLGRHLFVPCLGQQVSVLCPGQWISVSCGPTTNCERKASEQFISSGYYPGVPWAHLDNTLMKWTVQKFCSTTSVFTQWAKHSPVLRSPLKSNTSHLNMGWFMVTGSFKWKHEEYIYMHGFTKNDLESLSSGWSFPKDSTLSYP